MPPAEQVPDALERIANEWRPLALIWHVYFVAIAGAVAAGWRPSRALAGLLLGAAIDWILVAGAALSGLAGARRAHHNARTPDGSGGA